MREYNPLSVEELGRSAAKALMGYSVAKLPPPKSFDGAGVYTIHYRGDFPAYANMGEKEPIYVGKADPAGRRQGRSPTTPQTAVLYQRLTHHARSIATAENLNLPDFSCRWLVLDPVWIGLTEQVLISEYRPIWNSAIDGFGNNDPGKGRWNQRRSQWDTLHPGRNWALNLQDRGETVADILAVIARHRRKISA